MDDILIRQLSNTDHDFYLLLGKFLSKRNIVKEIGAPVWDDDHVTWFVAIVNNVSVGFSSMIKRKNHIEFLRSYVSPEYRNQGIYNKLFGFRMERAQKDTIKIKAVASGKSINTYLRYGFQIKTKYKYDTLLAWEADQNE
jgi:GNAT superfamily N-acetyltransferase